MRLDGMALVGGRMRALSIRQPWTDAILHGGKRLENRTEWTACSFRGAFLIHASMHASRKYYRGVQAFVAERGIPWQPPPVKSLVRGALVGHATVVDVIMPGQLVLDGVHAPKHRHPLVQDPYYMGKLALVLEDVVAWETPIPYSGSLGFFRVELGAGLQTIPELREHARAWGPT